MAGQAKGKAERRRRAVLPLFLMALLVLAAPGWSSRHRVREGENLTIIARQYGKTVAEVRALNPQVRDPSRITPGQILVIANEPLAGPRPDVEIAPRPKTGAAFLRVRELAGPGLGRAATEKLSLGGPSQIVTLEVLPWAREGIVLVQAREGGEPRVEAYQLVGGGAADRLLARLAPLTEAQAYIVGTRLGGLSGVYGERARSWDGQLVHRGRRTFQILDRNPAERLGAVPAPLLQSGKAAGMARHGAVDAPPGSSPAMARLRARAARRGAGRVKK